MHLYIHVPFCKQACHYCDFHFSTSLKLKEQMVKTICSELELQRNFLKTSTLSSIYFGGGTPSLLSLTDLEVIFNSIQKYFIIDSEAEITLEANPDDITSSSLDCWKKAGINRLSLGIQSFDDEQLKFLNRAHNSKEANQCVQQARDQGFEQLTIDLIYAIPSKSNDIWKKNLEKAIALDIPHISSYCLTIEEKTVFGSQAKKGTLSPIDDEFASSQYQLLIDSFAQNGLEQYEISNFARNGSYAKHNTSYWKGDPYLGIGPSAHSFDGYKTRQWNISNNAKYIKAIDKGKPAFEQEVLSSNERVNELLMTGLRTKWGVDLKLVETLEPKFQKLAYNELNILIKQNLLIHTDNRLILTQKGLIQADGIASDLFLV